MSIDFTPEERATIVLQAKSSAAYAMGFYLCILLPPVACGFYGLAGGGVEYVVVGFLGIAFFSLLLVLGGWRGTSTYSAICRKIVASWTDDPAPAPSHPVPVDAPQ